MDSSKKTLEFKFERTILAPPEEVFDGWLNPKIPGNPWNMAEKLLLNPKVGRILLLERQGHSPLRAIHRGRTARPASAHLGITQHVGRRINGQAHF